MELKNVLIVGAGELGSRHLQGVLKSNYDFNVYCIDPLKSSLERANDRSDEIKHNHNLYFNTDINSVPKDIFLCIVATSANIREAVLKNLLKDFKIDNLVLEKVLFQKLQSFSELDEILKNPAISTNIWVNHPRRMLTLYQKLVDMKSSFGLLRGFSLIGTNWGMACNSLHYLDLFEFISGEKLIEINAEGLNNNIYESKRAGFIELSGKLSGKLTNEVKFEIEELIDVSSTNVSLIISFEKCIIYIQEAPFQYCKIIYNEQENLDLNFSMKYQSSLSTEIVDSLFNGQKLNLPEYQFSVNTHSIFIQEMLRKYNQIRGVEGDVLPIT